MNAKERKDLFLYITIGLLVISNFIGVLIDFKQEKNMKKIEEYIITQ